MSSNDTPTQPREVTPPTNLESSFHDTAVPDPKMLHTLDATSRDKFFSAFDYRVFNADGSVESVRIDREQFESLLSDGNGSGEEGDLLPDDAWNAPERDLPRGEPIELLRRSVIDNYPFRTIGRLSVGCTATLISRRCLITAAHCVDQGIKGTTFRRAQHGSEEPGERFTCERAYVPEGFWNNDTRNQFDYSIIVLDREVAEGIGRLRFGYRDDLPETGERININGYPAGHKKRMYHVDCTVTPLRSQNWLYPCDTLGGMSGSAIYVRYETDNNRRVIYGVHRGGYNSKYNIGVRINKAVFLQLRSWKRAHDSSEEGHS